MFARRRQRLALENPSRKKPLFFQLDGTIEHKNVEIAGKLQVLKAVI